MMNVNINTRNGIVIITIAGSIDSKTAGELQSQIMGQVMGAQKVIIDFAQVDYLSSAGLRLLLMVYRQLKAHEGIVVLTGLSEEIQDVMSMTGFINFFQIMKTVEEAEAQL
jgi:anti-sigma B factor antagonist